MLQSQIVDIQLGGLDTGTQAKNVVLGKMLELENASFRTRGALSKRLGNASVVSSPGTVKRLYSVDGALYSARINGTEVINQISAARGAAAVPTFSKLACPAAWVDSVSGTLFTQVDSASNGTYTCYVGQTSETTKRFVAVLCDSTGQPISQSTIASATGGVRVFAPSGASYFVILTLNSSTNELKVWDLAHSTGTITNRATITNVDAAYGWDACVQSDGSAVYLLSLQYLSTTTIRLHKVTLSSWAVTSTTWTGAGQPTALGVCAGSDVRCFWSDTTGTGGALSTRTYSTSLVNTLATTVVVATSVRRYGISAQIRASDTTTVALFWDEQSNTSAKYTRHIEYRVVSDAGVASGAQTIRGAGLLSKSLEAVGTDRHFVAAVYDEASGLQRTYFLLEVSNSDTFVRARLLHGLANTFPGEAPTGVSVLCNLHTAASSTELVCAAIRRGNSSSDVLVFGGSADGSLCGLHFDCDTTHGWHAAELNGELLVTGGYLQALNEAGIAENGHLLYPQIISATPSTSGGSIPDGVYSVIAIYEYVDAKGKLRQSALSPPSSATVSGGGGSGSISVVVESYRLKGASGSPAALGRIVVYRTAAGGSTYYRDKVVDNNGGADSVTLTCTSSAALLTASPALYTTGSEAENEQPDAPLAIATDNNRAWVVSGNDRLRVLPSKPDNGTGTNFYFDVSSPVDSKGGTITALARLDGKLLAFAKRGVRYAAGAGPDITGNNNTLSDFEMLHPSIGAVDQRSVLVTGAGVYARGQGGIWLVGRDLSPSYAGEDVASYNTTSLTDACYVGDLNEVRWLLSTGTELVYHEQRGQWSTNPTIYGNCMVVHDGARHFNADTSLGSGTVTAGIYKESGYVDAHRTSTGFAMRMVTSWLQFGSLGRVWNILFTGELKSAHDLQFRFRVNGESTWSSALSLASTNITIDSSDYDGAVNPPVQKCRLMSIEVQDTSPVGESFVMTKLSAHLGVKPGVGKTRSEKRV